MTNRSVDFRRVFLVGALVSLSVSYILLWVKMITNPVEYTRADFVTFYTAGRIGQEYGLDHVYKFELQKAVEDELVGFSLPDDKVLPHNHLPFLNPILVALVAVTGGDYLSGFITWVVVLLALNGLAVWLLMKSMPQLGGKKAFLFLALFLFFPIYVSLLNGQDTAFLLVGAGCFYLGIMSEKPWLAGMGLALMTIRPHFALVLAIPFLFRHRKVFLWFVAFASLLALVSILQLGYDGLKDFLWILFDTAVRSGEAAMLNFIGVARRLLPGVDPAIIRTGGWSIYAVSIFVLGMVWRKQERLSLRLLGLATVVCLFVAPHFHYHDLALLVFPVAAALTLAVDKRVIQPENAPLPILAISLILMMGFVSESVQFTLPAVLMVILAVVLIWPEKMLLRKKRSGSPG